MKTIKNYFTAHYFIQFKNEKFLIIEGAFIYFIAACMILAYGVLYHFNTVQIIPFILPLAFGFYMVMQKGVEDITDLQDHWRTQLRLLGDPRMAHVFNTDYDKRLEEILAEKFISVHGVKFENLVFVRLQKWQPIALVVLVLLVVWFYS